MKAISKIKQEVYDVAGNLESGRYIAKGDECIVSEVNDNLLISISYPTSKGMRASFVRSLEDFDIGIIAFNQNDYSDVPYPAPGYENATIKSGGCGPTAMAVVLANMGIDTDPVKMAQYAIDCGARVSGGTNMKTLSKNVADDFGIGYEESSDIEQLKMVVEAGGYAIVNTGGDRSGHRGIFSNGGHYIAVVGRAGEDFMIVDPGLYNGKYNPSYRSKYVTVSGEFLYAGERALILDSENRRPRYYLYIK